MRKRKSSLRQIKLGEESGTYGREKAPEGGDRKWGKPKEGKADEADESSNGGK